MDEEYQTERRRQMLTETEPFVFAMFFAAAMASGGKPNKAAKDADSMLALYQARYPVPEEPSED